MTWAAGEDKWPRVLKLQSPGEREWRTDDGIDLSVTLPSLNGLPCITAACSTALPGDVFWQVWSSLLSFLLCSGLRVLPPSPGCAHCCIDCFFLHALGICMSCTSNSFFPPCSIGPHLCPLAHLRSSFDVGGGGRWRC